MLSFKGVASYEAFVRIFLDEFVTETGIHVRE